MTDEVQQTVVGKMGYTQSMIWKSPVKGNVTKIKELGKNERSSKNADENQKNSRLEKFGKTITFLCMSLIVVVVTIWFSWPIVNKVIILVLFGSTWNPLQRNSSLYQWF